MTEVQPRLKLSGLSVFPLTPMVDDHIDFSALGNLVQRLKSEEVDSITVLGSTGCYAYLDAYERQAVLDCALEAAGAIPVLAGIGALRTSHVMTHARQAEQAGASGVLLAPVSYQPLTDNDVLELFRAVTDSTDLPVVLYDNPVTTGFTFHLDLYSRVAALEGVAAIKIPPIPGDQKAMDAHVADVRNAVGDEVVVGISGDAAAVRGLRAGCDTWYSVLGGTLPELAQQIVAAADTGKSEDQINRDHGLTTLWDLFAQYGSLRVIAAVAEELGLVRRPCLPQPLLGLDDAQRLAVQNYLRTLTDS
ncbi:MAG: dihydrodipicolinate synthase family protein [Kocuria sp.]|nr:dihydrodipicolinate synthase family protein [Kocuria sp.]MDO5617306.1 dihydrodipicolinate synthase family protein [Kocuria sp.]